MRFLNDCFAPDIVAKTRVAWRSPLYGFPPLAVRRSLDTETETRLRTALLGMSDSAQGKALLGELNLTGFGPFRPEVFDSIAALVAVAAGRSI